MYFFHNHTSLSTSFCILCINEIRKFNKREHNYCSQQDGIYKKNSYQKTYLSKSFLVAYIFYSLDVSHSSRIDTFLRSSFCSYRFVTFVIYEDSPPIANPAPIPTAGISKDLVA